MKFSLKAMAWRFDRLIKQWFALRRARHGATWTVATPREPVAQEKLDAAERSELIFTYE